MKIASYVDEIEHAATGVLTLLWKEVERFEALAQRNKELSSRAQQGYERALSWQESGDPEDIAGGAGLYWETYFGDDKARNENSGALEQVTEQIAIQRFSMDSLAGSLLQYAKQGISLAFASPAGAPKCGRLIGSQSLADVIWSGRNQSLHWEAGEFRAKTSACFRALAAEVCQRFADFERRNQGYHLVYHLDWRNFTALKTDLLSLDA